MSPKRLELIGKRFSRLVVEAPVGYLPGGFHWRCRCDCGNTTIVAGTLLKRTLVRSCGCYRMELLRAGALRKTHGETSGGRWDERSAEWRSWSSMIHRCYQPTTIGWHRYGGRGITVCDRWRGSYSAFLEDMGRKPTPQHTLDRYPNPDGNYEPGNVRWATKKEQANNRGTK